MARRRMIDPGFWTSEHNTVLSIQERLLFLGLISTADDSGRLKGNAAFIRATVFPYDEIPVTEIADNIAHLESEGLISVYTVDSFRYIQIKKWDVYQRIDRPQASKYPPCPLEDSPGANDSTKVHDLFDESSRMNRDNSRLKEVKGKEVKGKEENITPDKSGDDYLDGLLSIFCQEYQASRGMVYQVINRGKEKAALGKLQGLYKKEHPEKTSAEAYEDFRSYFKAAINISDTWLRENMSPSILASKHNEIRTILHKRKGGVTDAELTAIYSLQ